MFILFLLFSITYVYWLIRWMLRSQNGHDFSFKYKLFMYVLPGYESLSTKIFLKFLAEKALLKYKSNLTKLRKSMKVN